MWQSVLNTIDRVESWLVLLPVGVQIPLLLAVLVPLAWYLAKAIDPLVEWLLVHVRRTARPVQPTAPTAPTEDRPE